MTLVVRDGKPSFYESHREAGRVVTWYICCDQLALQMQELKTYYSKKFARLASASRARRRERERELEDKLRRCKARLASRRAEVTRVEQVTKDQFRRVEAIHRLAMQAAGYRRHNRGEW
jgi:hypothetical protein